MKLKVCGMKIPENIIEVAALQPNYMGFIFYEKSPRNLDSIIPEIHKSIKKTGVFVDAELNFILKKIKQHNLQAVQLHGKESPAFCRALKAFYNSEHSDTIGFQASQKSKIEILKVFSIKDEFDFTILKPYEQVCDYFLFDTKGKNPGGNGYTFNWDVLKEYPSTKPYLLSGGIGIDEVEKIKEFKKTSASKYCYAIDINSKFEIEPGLKHIKELETFKQHISSIDF